MLYKRTKLSLHLLLALAAYSPVYVSAVELSLPDFPLQVTEYIEPNVMLLLDTSGSMTTVDPGTTESRMDIMKEIATDLIAENKNIRFCLARFRYDQGGKILSECGSTAAAISNMTAAINALTAFGSTPLAEAYYEVINYFAGSTPKYKDGPATDHVNNDNTLAFTLSNGKYASPIKYRCQKNYAIVLTDGAPQLDSYFPAFPSKQNADKQTSIHTAFSEAIGPDGNYDQVDNDGDGGLYGVYYYLDDMAKYAWDIDLKDSSLLDDAGISFNDSSNGDEFKKQNLNTYTVGFTLDIDMLRAAADYGQGGDGSGGKTVEEAAKDHYYSANNKAELKQAFADAIDQISDENQSSAEPTTNSDLYSNNLRLFQTRFTNTKWTGELLSYQIEALTNKLVRNWIAPASFPASWGNRVVDAGINGGVPLKWGKLTSAQKNAWFGGTQDVHKQRLNYIRGKTASQIGSSNYRIRESLMGDIVNSSPAYVGPPEATAYQYSDLKTSYASFVTTRAQRDAMIYVGANDGMLHGFDLTGQEKVAFVPSKVMPNLAELSASDYRHKFYVDGAPLVANVYAPFVNGVKSWRTVLVGGLRRGGQGIYALDITDPARFVNGGNSVDNARARQTLLWEFSDDETLAAASTTDKYTGDKDLGYSYSQPQILRLNDGEFYVVLGSGYNNTESDGHQSTTGDAVLYLLNVVTGAVEKKISTGYGAAEDPARGLLGNGLATVTGFDAGELQSDGTIQGNEDGKIDYVYAGDLFGNVWKFNLASADPQDWNYVAEKKLDNSLNPNRNPIKLFSAKDVNNKVQAITVQLQAHKLQDGEVMIYFGTGKLLENADTKAINVVSRSGNTFYGIVDKNTEITGRSELLEQKITYQEEDAGQEQREVTSHIRVNQKGWYIDLQKPTYDSNNVLSYEQEGEQVIVTARVENNVVFFVTRFADQDVCLLPERKDFLMTLGVRSGAALNYIIIDTDGNGVIDDNDNTRFGNKANSSAVSGRTGYGSQLPIIVQTGEGTKGAEVGLICDATECHKMQSGDKEWKRTSWQEIEND
ncbi:MAG: PilC/PilY family type IV pilus protein [Oceanospirillaceae bacterium]